MLYNNFETLMKSLSLTRWLSHLAAALFIDLLYILEFCYSVVVFIPRFLNFMLRDILAAILFDQFLIKSAIRLFVFVEASYYFYKLALLGFFKYYNKNEQAENLQNELTSQANSIYEYLKKNSGKIAVQIFLGILAGFLSIGTAITISIILSAVGIDPSTTTGNVKTATAKQKFNTKMNYNYNTFFIDVVIFAPITEEIIYRGVLMNFLKSMYESILSYFVKPAEPNNATSASVEAQDTESGTLHSTTTVAHSQDDTKEKNTYLAQHGANFTSALLFGSGHMQYNGLGMASCFISGMMWGELNRRVNKYYEDDSGNDSVVPSIAAHMTHNFIAISPTFRLNP